MMISVHYGFGQHIYNLSRDNLLITLKVSSPSASAVTPLSLFFLSGV